MFIRRENVDVGILGCNAVWTHKVDTSVSEEYTGVIFRAECVI
jgi:hypothetical protein